MNYFIIKAKGASVFWTGTQWHHPAKRYKSRKIAENAIRKTTNHYEFSTRKRSNRNQSSIKFNPVKLTLRGFYLPF